MLAQGLARIDHALGHLEYNSGLLPVGRRAIDFRAGFVIGKERILAMPAARVDLPASRGIMKNTVRYLRAPSLRFQPKTELTIFSVCQG